MSFVLSTFHIALFRDQYGHWFPERALALRAFGQILEERSSLQAAMIGHALNCVEPSLSLLQNQNCPWAIGFVLLSQVIYIHSHKYTKLAFAHYFNLVFSQLCVSQNTPKRRFTKESNMPM